jgi:SAM-dependent methyltransferase
MEDPTIHEMYRLEDHHWWFIGKRLLVDALLDGVLRPGRVRLLDVGCGTGGVLAHLREGVSTVGVDRSVQALAYCRQRGLDAVACADAHRLPFAPASFDAVLLLDALEHVADEAVLLDAVRDLLRPGGSLLISVPAYQFLWSKHDEVLHHVRRYTGRSLRRALDASGFSIRRLTYTNVAALPLAVLVRGILARLGLMRTSGTDFELHAPWLNRALIAAYRLEATALRHVPRLPFGLSVAALATPAS